MDNISSTANPPIPVPNQADVSPIPASPKKIDKILIAIVILSILAVLLIVIFGWMLWKKKNLSAGNPATSASSHATASEVVFSPPVTKSSLNPTSLPSFTPTPSPSSLTFNTYGNQKYHINIEYPQIGLDAYGKKIACGSHITEKDTSFGEHNIVIDSLISLRIVNSTITISNYIKRSGLDTYTWNPFESSSASEAVKRGNIIDPIGDSHPTSIRYILRRDGHDLIYLVDSFQSPGDGCNTTLDGKEINMDQMVEMMYISAPLQH